MINAKMLRILFRQLLETFGQFFTPTSGLTGQHGIPGFVVTGGDLISKRS